MTVKRIAMAALLGLGTIAASPALALDNVPPFLLQWGAPGAGSGQFVHTYAIATGPQGYIYVSDEDSRIQVFTSNGAFVAQWGQNGPSPGQFGTNIYGIAVNAAGDVYATSYDRVHRFGSLGNYVQRWGGYGNGPGQFSTPTGIAIDSKGFVYVADSDNNRIQKFTADGVFVSQWGTLGAGPGQLRAPYGVAIDAQDNVYVSDFGNYRIQRFRADSTFVVAWSGNLSDSTAMYPIGGIATDSYGLVYVPSWSYDNVVIWDSTGTYRYKWGSVGSAPSQFNRPMGVAIDQGGKIYIADELNYRIQKFDGGGVTSVPRLGAGAGLMVQVLGSPARRGPIAFQIDGAPNADVRGGVYDLTGRMLKEIRGHTDAGGGLRILWGAGDIALGPGMYFLRVKQTSESAHAKFVVL